MPVLQQNGVKDRHVNPDTRIGEVYRLLLPYLSHKAGEYFTFGRGQIVWLSTQTFSTQIKEVSDLAKFTVVTLKEV